MHNLLACAIKATLQLAKVHTNPVALHPWESLEYLNQFQCICHNIFTIYSPSYAGLEKHLTFPQKPMAMQFPPTKSEEKKCGNQKVNSSGFLMSFPRTRTMTRLILSSSTKIHFVDSQPPKYLKVKASAFGKNLHFVCVKPSVTHVTCRCILVCFRFMVLQSSNKNKQTFNYQLSILKQKN